VGSNPTPAVSCKAEWGFAPSFRRLERVHIREGRVTAGSGSKRPEQHALWRATGARKGEETQLITKRRGPSPHLRLKATARREPVLALRLDGRACAFTTSGASRTTRRTRTRTRAPAAAVCRGRKTRVDAATRRAAADSVSRLGPVVACVVAIAAGEAVAWAGVAVALLAMLLLVRRLRPQWARDEAERGRLLHGEPRKQHRRSTHATGDHATSAIIASATFAAVAIVTVVVLLLARFF
jgi:hypothetical protein